MLLKGTKWFLKGENVPSLRASQALILICLFVKVLLAGAPPLIRARPWATGSMVLSNKKSFCSGRLASLMTSVAP